VADVRDVEDVSQQMMWLMLGMWRRSVMSQLVDKQEFNTFSRWNFARNLGDSALHSVDGIQCMKCSGVDGIQYALKVHLGPSQYLQAICTVWVVALLTLSPVLS